MNQALSSDIIFSERVCDGFGKASALDFEPIKSSLTLDKRFGNKYHLIDEVMLLYKEFLALYFAYPKSNLVPSKDIDLVWHYHILDTKKYKEDCDKLFGYFLHHFPYLGLRGVEDQALLQKEFEHTCFLWTQHFGHSPFHFRNSANDSAYCSGSSCSSCSTRMY